MRAIERTWFIRQARRLRLERTFSSVLLGSGAAFLAAGIARQLGGGFGTVVAAALSAGLLASLGSIYQVRRRPLTADVVAAHLNRTVPGVEESAQLLLADPGELGILAQLQRRRAERILRSAVLPARFPDARREAHYRLAALTAALGVALVLLPRAGAGTPIDGSLGGRDAGSTESVVLPTIRGVAITVIPPAYTRRATRRTEEWDLEAEEGARIQWELGTAGPAARGVLVTAAGDTVVLRRLDDDRFGATIVAQRSTLYRLVVETVDGRSAAAIDHRLSVLPDAPPVLTVVLPEQRTEIWPGDAMRLQVEVLANDDHGVDSTVIIATVTKGQGEGVKFREQSFAFASRSAREPSGLVLRQTLDLARLGLEPGDELYFHAMATDRRTPAPNVTKSETIFVSMVDTTREPLGPGAGVTLNLPPDFFRSQRQLIIDTERLLADQRQIARQLFQHRSNDLGLDQGLLRLRYGQFMGDEFEGELVASGREAHADHADDEPPPEPVVDRITGVATVDPQAALLHDHDDPENATLLAPEVKAKLRDAISAMWSAELQLRLAEPRKSLPFQQRALELLQEIRQDARSYVRRVGFDPPPLEPDRRRLAGDLSKIRIPVVRQSADASLPDPDLRTGLITVQRLRGGGPVHPGDADQLERTGQALGRLAVDDPLSLLEPLRALRRGITALSADGSPCPECWTVAETGLWRALPDAAPLAGLPRGRPPSLAERYFRLRDRRP